MRWVVNVEIIVRQVNAVWEHELLLLGEAVVAFVVGAGNAIGEATAAGSIVVVVVGTPILAITRAVAAIAVTADIVSCRAVTPHRRKRRGTKGAAAAEKRRARAAAASLRWSLIRPLPRPFDLFHRGNRLHLAIGIATLYIPIVGRLRIVIAFLFANSCS